MLHKAKNYLSILLLLFPFALHAAPLQLGAGVYFESSPVVSGFDLCIWGLKAEARFNALSDCLSIETPVALGFDEDLVELSLRPALMLSLPFGSSMRIDAGIGTQMKVTLHTDGTWSVNNLNYYTTGSAFSHMSLDYRAGVMFWLRDDMSVRFSLRVPTEGTFSDPGWNPDWDRAEVSASLLVDVRSLTPTQG